MTAETFMDLSKKIDASMDIELQRIFNLFVEDFNILLNDHLQMVQVLELFNSLIPKGFKEEKKLEGFALKI